MATQTVTPMSAGSALRAAIANNTKPASPVVMTDTPRLTAPGSDEARKGVSLQDQMAAMMAEMKALREVALSAPVARGKAAKAPKPAPVEETGPWYARKAYLGRTDKVTGALFYDVDLDSVMATEDMAIMRSNAFSNTVLFIKGKRKPVYLSATALGVMLAGFSTLTGFAKANADYLKQCIADSTEDKD